MIHKFRISMLKKNSVGAIALQAVVIFATVLVVTLVVSAATSRKKEKPTAGLPRGNSLAPFEPRKKRQIRKQLFPPGGLDPFNQPAVEKINHWVPRDKKIDSLYRF